MLKRVHLGSPPDVAGDAAANVLATQQSAVNIKCYQLGIGNVPFLFIKAQFDDKIESFALDFANAANAGFPIYTLIRALSEEPRRSAVCTERFILFMVCNLYVSVKGFNVWV